MNFFRRLFPSSQPPVSSSKVRDEQTTNQLDQSVDQRLVEAITTAVNRELERLGPSYLKVLEGQIDSVKELAPRFPDGIPVSLVAGELRTFAEELAKACRQTAEELVRAFDKDGDNVLVSFQSAFENASNYTFTLRRHLIRGCNDIYYRGYNLALTAYPTTDNDKLLDAPWLLERIKLFDASYSALSEDLSHALSPEKRGSAAVVVLCERVENAVWEKTSLFLRCFMPVLRKQLYEAPAFSWRETEAFRNSVTEEYVSLVVPNHRDDRTYHAIEDIACAYLFFQAEADHVSEELAKELQAKFIAEFPYRGADAGLDEKLKTFVSSTVKKGFDGVLDDALKLARERAAQVLSS